MIIHRIELFHISLQLAHPFETSFGYFEERHPVILKVCTDVGTTYADAPCLIGPFYNPETTQTTLHIIRDHLAPRLLGREIESVEDLHRKMAFVRGNNIARSGLDTAFYHLLSAQAGRSLSRYLGGSKRYIESGISIGVQPSLDELEKVVGRALDTGYARIKIKIKPGWDLEPVRMIRRQFGDIPLMADANSAYTLDAVALFKQLDRYDLTMIEQPLGHEDLTDHSVLQAQIRTPICLDESIQTVSDAKAALALDACKVINIKLTRVGGLLPAVMIHDLCRERGIPVWCGGMVESAIGQADSIALASLPNFQFPSDIAPSERYFERDLISPFISLEDGKIRVPTDIGLGFDVDTSFLEQCTLEHFVIEE